MLSAQISHPLTKSMTYNDVTYLIRKRPSPSRGGGKIKGFRFLLPFGPEVTGPVLITPDYLYIDLKLTPPRKKCTELCISVTLFIELCFFYTDILQKS